MKINLKPFIVAIFCLITAACTTTSSLSQLAYKEKIRTINLHHLSDNISIDLSNGDSHKRNDFKLTQRNLNDFDVNNILKNSLHHHLLDGKAFSESVVINSVFDKNVKAGYLIPVLTPSITMSDDYSVVNVSLATSTVLSKTNDQNKFDRVYSSQKIFARGTSRENQQYSIDHPLLLKETIINALYDVAQQFANDYNGVK